VWNEAVLAIALEHWQWLASLGGLLVFWSWESLAPFFTFKGPLRHALPNLAIAAFNIVTVTTIFAGTTIAVTEYAQQAGLGLVYWASLGSVPGFVVALLALDCWSYWWHRANHSIPLLWRFHRTHHSDPAMDVTTATRFHAGELALSSTLRLGVILLAGAPLMVIVLYDFLLLLSTQFHHSNIALAKGMDRALRLAIVSPNMHKMHHSDVRAEMDSNYTSILSVWDRVFGTYRECDDYRQVHFGVPGFADARFQTILGLLRTPFAKAVRDVERADPST